MKTIEKESEIHFNYLNSTSPKEFVSDVKDYTDNKTPKNFENFVESK